jgi:hypothetical protein
MAKPKALREARTHRLRLLQMLVGLDPLGDDQRAGAFVMGEDTGEGAGPVGLRTALDHRHIELDDVRSHDVQHRERIRMCANIIDGDSNPVGADRSHLVEQRTWMREQLALGEFEDHLKSFARVGQRRIVRPGGVCDRGLGIDQQQTPVRQLGGQRGLDRRIDALLVEDGGPLRRVREGEHVLWRHRDEGWPSRQRLEANHLFVGQ